VARPTPLCRVHMYCGWFLKSQGCYKYRYGMPKQEKDQRLDFQWDLWKSLEDCFGLPVMSLEVSHVQWCHWKSHKYWHRWFFLLWIARPLCIYSDLVPKAGPIVGTLSIKVTLSSKVWLSIKVFLCLCGLGWADF
jgi:hypothetical protein